MLERQVTFRNAFMENASKAGGDYEETEMKWQKEDIKYTGVWKGL